MTWSVDSLLTFLKAAGPKFAQVWPAVVNIAENIKVILAILGAGDSASRKFGSTPASDKGNEIVTLAKSHGINIDEARRVAAVFEAAEAELSD